MLTPWSRHCLGGWVLCRLMAKALPNGTGTPSMTMRPATPEKLLRNGVR